MNEDLKEELIANGYDFAGVMDRLADSEALYEDLLKQFMLEENLESIMDGYATQDYESMFMGVHTLKGVAGNLGLTGIYKTSSQLTEKLRAEDYVDLEQYVDAVKQEYEACLALLKKYYN